MKNRITSLDLLKILAIFLIVSFHASFKGIPAPVANNLNWFNQILYFLFYHFGELGVNLFMLITGFFLVNSRKVHWSKIIKFIIDVYFFSLISVLFCIIMNKYVFHIKDLFPITFSYYWYITGYLIIYILSPFINRFIKCLSHKDFFRFLFILFVILSLIPTLASFITGNTEELGFYNRFTWLLFIYLVGCYLSIYRHQTKIMIYSVKEQLLILLKILITIISFAIFAYFAKINTGLFSLPVTLFWGPNSIVMFFMSLSIFALFYHLKIPNNKLISVISESTLSVYLLHEHPKFLFILWLNIFSLPSFYYSKKLFLVILGASLLVILAGVIMHHIKKYTFDKFINCILAKIGVIKQ